MKFSVALVFCLLGFISSFSQRWTQAQLDSASTGSGLSQLSAVEKEAITYLNLARMYPRQFAETEVKDYSGAATMGASPNSNYRKSLLKDLTQMKPLSRLAFDNSLYALAKCFAKESGDRGSMGHTRKNCPKPSGFFGECCSYGMQTGKDIAIQLLIDEGLKDLGHRKIILTPEFTKVGLSVAPHKKFGTNTVIDFSN